MALQEEIEKGSRDIATDGYPMSIGEIMSLYKDGDLDLHPEFQREYRWKLSQKSRLIESILLGIPLPSVFVFQRKDGVWDVIDGLQRLSTILEFAGELKDENGTLVPPLQLAKTRYLPSLADTFWDNEAGSKSLDDVQRRTIKRSKLDIKIVKSDSSETSKFELFDRLNTGGTIASGQEVRNCLLIMANREMFYWLKGLANDPNFVACTALSSRQIEEKYDIELVLRLILFKDISDTELRFEELGDFLTERMLAVAAGKIDLDRNTSGAAFTEVFKVLTECGLAEDSFRKYDWTKQKFVGAFSISSFEAVSIGLGTRFTTNPNFTASPRLEAAIKDLWCNPIFLSNSGSGVRAGSRIPKIVPLGRILLANV